MTTRQISLGIPRIAFEFAEAKIDQVQSLRNELYGAVCKIIAVSRSLSLLAGKLKLFLQHF